LAILKNLIVSKFSNAVLAGAFTIKKKLVF